MEGGVFGRGSRVALPHQSLSSVLGRSLAGCANWDLISGPALLFVNELD